MVVQLVGTVNDVSFVFFEINGLEVTSSLKELVFLCHVGLIVFKTFLQSVLHHTLFSLFAHFWLRVASAGDYLSTIYQN